MPFFSLRTTKSSSSLTNSQSSPPPSSLATTGENTNLLDASVNGTNQNSSSNTTTTSPKSSKTSPKKAKKLVVVVEEKHEEFINIEPTPLHPYLQSPSRRYARASSVKTLSTLPPPNSTTTRSSPITLPQHQPTKQSSASFSPNNKYISNIHHYSRKRSNSMDASELAKTLNGYSAMKERQIAEENLPSMSESDLSAGSSSMSSSNSSNSSSGTTTTSSSIINESTMMFSTTPIITTSTTNNNSLLKFDDDQHNNSSSSDQSSDEEKQTIPTSSNNSTIGDTNNNAEFYSPNSPALSEDESKKIQESAEPQQPAVIDLSNISRKEFKKLPHLRKRLARNSLKTQFEMSKEREAIELEREAKKFASRSLTRWKPDYDSAGVSYEKAGAIFKALKQPGKAISCYTNSGECFYKCGIYYKSGQGFENAGNVCRDTKDFNLAVELYTKASTSYLDDGKGNRAGEALTKAAKMLAENGQIPQSIELYKSALESLAMGGAYHNAMSTYRSYNDFLIRNSQWEEAITNSMEMIVGYKALTQHDNVNKTCTSIVMISLRLDDFVRADEYHKKFQSEHNSYGTCKECEISEDFLDAFERMDSNAVETAKQNHHLKYLEPSIYKMVSKLSLTGGVGGLESTTQPKKTRKPKQIDANKASLLSHSEEEEQQLSIEDDNPQLSDPSHDEDHSQQLIPENDDGFDPNDLT